MRRYCVIGNPIEHSLSPQIHAAFAREAGVEQSYEKVLFPVGEFETSLERYRREHGLDGANVTVPFKLDAWRYAAEKTERARKAGAVNTLRFEGDTVLGDNTDGVGFIRDVERRHGVAFADARLLILGAGGAARGLLAVVTELPLGRLAIANRTQAKAEVLASEFHCEALPFAETAAEHWDIVVNATSAGITRDCPAVPAEALADVALCYELFYGKEPTAFMAFAARSGARHVVDGLGMLVEQAAASFELWRGIDPSTDSVYDMLRRRFS